MKMQKSYIKIKSKIKNRIRIYHYQINKDCDEFEFANSIKNIPGIIEARINKNAKNIIFTHKEELQKNDLIKIIKTIKDIPIPKISKKRTISKIEIYKSLLALGISFLPIDDKIKIFFSIMSFKPTLQDALQDIKKKLLSSKVLEALAVGVSLVRQDFIAANGTNFMLSLGEYMEESTSFKSDELIKELAKPDINEIWVEKKIDGETKMCLCKTNSLKKGDIVVASAGSHIGVDGYIVQGNASINEVSMTGEATPVNKTRGDRVLSGTLVQEGNIKIWAENVGDQVATQRIKKYIQNALNEKSKTGLKANKLADKLVPVTLGLALISYFFKKNFNAPASVLQADYSCALKLATPVAFKSSISKAGNNGIIIKGSKSIEELRNCDCFIFDKTGTLTKGELKVLKIIPLNKNLNEEKLLNLAASAEEHYFHPVAEAIVNAAKERGFKHIHHDEVEFIVAHGIKTTMQKKEVLIGSRHFLEDDEKIIFNEKANKIIKEILDNGLTALYIAYGGELAGIISLKDELRENAKQNIYELKKLGVKEIIMLTGDIQSRANDIARELCIDKVYASCLPTDKTKVIEDLRKQGKKVVFIGDGINDAPSLSKANVGICMHKGADIAKATADIALLKDDLSSITEIKKLSNKTMNLIDKNFKATVIINSGILLLASFGLLSPIITAILHNGTTIWILSNSIKGVELKDKFEKGTK